MVRTPAHEPLFEIDPLTPVNIEVFYADRSLETFGWCGAGWFWWARCRGYAPASSATGPFATRYAAYRDAILERCPSTEHFANKALLSMCQTCDMDLLT
jgi:hypothetical protein